jgi:hypothetical protein
MPSVIRWWLVILLALVFISLGAMREVLFVNINEQILFNDGGVDRYRVVPHLWILKEYSTEELLRWKWIMTILFTLAYLLLSAITLKQALRFKGARRLLFSLYLIGFFVSGLSYLLGRWFGYPDLGYTISRVIMGGLQSPFPLMLIIPALLLKSSE